MAAGEDEGHECMCDIFRNYGSSSSSKNVSRGKSVTNEGKATGKVGLLTFDEIGEG